MYIGTIRMPIGTNYGDLQTYRNKIKFFFFLLSRGVKKKTSYRIITLKTGLLCVSMHHVFSQLYFHTCAKAVTELEVPRDAQSNGVFFTLV